MLALILLIIGVVSRLVPHVSQFTALLAVGMFAGLYLNRRMSLIVSLGTLLISDVLLGFHDTMAFTWGSMVLITFVGHYLQAHKSWVNVIAGSVGSAVIFFIITNFGSFLTLYPRTWEGLVECYTLAIPFWRSTLVSTVAYSVVFYAGYEWLLARQDNKIIARLLKI